MASVYLTRITFGSRTGTFIKLVAVVALIQLALLVITNIELIRYWGTDIHAGEWLIHVQRDDLTQLQSNKSLSAAPKMLNNKSDSPEVVDFDYNFPSDVVNPPGFVWHATNTWELCSSLVSLGRTKALVNSSHHAEYFLRLHFLPGYDRLKSSVQTKVKSLLKKWTQAGGHFSTKDKKFEHIVAKSDADLLLKMRAFEFDLNYKTVMLLDPFAIPMKPMADRLFSDQRLSAVMIMAPQAKNKKSLKTVEEHRRRHPLNCFGKISRPISTSMIIADYSSLLVKRMTAATKKLKKFDQQSETPIEFFNHEFACNDEIALLPEKIVFEDVKDRESQTYDNAGLFVLNAKHKPWTKNYRPILESLPKRAKQFVIDWLTETNHVCDGHDGLTFDTDKVDNQSTLSMESSEYPELRVTKKSPNRRKHVRRHHRRRRERRELKSIL